jgi:hypothetical protein
MVVPSAEQAPNLMSFKSSILMIAIEKVSPEPLILERWGLNFQWSFNLADRDSVV